MKGIFLLSAFCLAALVVPSFGQSTADLYKTKCAMCHGADGKGATTIGPKIGAATFIARHWPRSQMLRCSP